MRIRGSFDSNASLLVEIAPGLQVPARGTVVATDCNGYDLHATVELHGGRYQCRELCITSRDDGSEVTGEAVRSVPVAGVIREGVLSMARATAALGGLQPPDGITEHGPTREALEWVARIYRLAYAVGDTPKKAVESALGLPPATAGRWVARAREAGYLAPATPGRAGV